MSDFYSHKSVAELIREQGGRPLSFEEMLGPLGGDAEKENVDEFLTMLSELDGPPKENVVVSGTAPFVPAK